jgi:hypothetical protein
MVSVLLTLIVIGVLCWLVVTYIPMADPFKKIFIAVAVILTVLWLLSLFGLFGAVTLFPRSVR